MGRPICHTRRLAITSILAILCGAYDAARRTPLAVAAASSFLLGSRR